MEDGLSTDVTCDMTKTNTILLYFISFNCQSNIDTPHSFQHFELRLKYSPRHTTLLSTFRASSQILASAHDIPLNISSFVSTLASATDTPLNFRASTYCQTTNVFSISSSVFVIRISTSRSSLASPYITSY
jgi:hypothetical protein